MTVGRLAVAGALALAGACRGSTDVVCPSIFIAPIVVQVRDAATGAPAAAGATGTIRSGGFDFTLVPSGTGTEALELRAGAGGVGTYDVRVTKPGYQEWTRAGVRVPGGRCGPYDSVVLDARLEPLP